MSMIPKLLKFRVTPGKRQNFVEYGLYPLYLNAKSITAEGAFLLHKSKKKIQKRFYCDKNVRTIYMETYFLRGNTKG